MNRVRATLTPLIDKKAKSWTGLYLIEVAGVALRSRYPENRMAKALQMAGFTGKFEVYGPSPDGRRTILRITVDVEKHARHQWSETQDGFRRLPWTERSLAPLLEAAAQLKRLLQEPCRSSGHTEAPGRAQSAPLNIRRTELSGNGKA